MEIFKFPGDAQHGILVYETPTGEFMVKTIGDNDRIVRMLLQTYINTQLNSLVVSTVSELANILAPVLATLDQGPEEEVQQ